MADNNEDQRRLRELTSALIHRFNNVLMGIQPHVEVIKRAGKDNERVLGSATQIETALKRAKAVMIEVSRLAKPPVLDMQPLAIDELFTTLRRDMQPFSQNPVELTFETDENLTVDADPEQLIRAIVHLVTNAVEAMPGGGAVTVSARGTDSGIVMKVADDGDGVMPEMVARVFEPLFTTKRNNAGLGLSVVQQVVEAHGGKVHFDSVRGEGTKVSFVLRKA